MLQGLSFLGRQVIVLYECYWGQLGRIRALDRSGLWIIELDEGDEYGPVVLALESQAFRLAT
ncbi:MAG: hypothetical protein KME03_15750 [Aphanocapsa lilacina HA4352-LM1]|jgi:hypothetical protein|uniref:Gsl3302 protein n=2 Tax=Gloeobacter TaxID=33071 RepID=Q7NG71_GLOVI|nr:MULTISPECIES: hypothetical protein [Gloeobacter]MBW4699314.1 hypothetical protein [Aphanocapsa lilacina HA4352-LM1]UFP94177.1 hypothetical protein ISF26_20835 [Gloeobacter morelensis MG652769]BAC91243.1 gsl3302 [Gloeobacter violaceus PCC 7421]